MPHMNSQGLPPGFYDVLLGVVVTAQATFLAYLHHPRAKALLLTLPFPFTVAGLAVGRPLDASNVLGMALLLLFTNAVRLLYCRLSVPIVFSIALSAFFYCAVGTLLAPRLPHSPAMFWSSVVFVVALAGAILRQMPPRDEPGHRTPLSLWQKVPLTALVVLGLVLLKGYLQGFLTMFPMVGVLGAYEARHSLWTISRHIPIVMLTMTPMMIACRLAQPALGLAGGLVASWMIFGLALWLWTRGSRRRDEVRHFTER